MIIINDIHLGTQRQAGTTPASQADLKQYLRDEFKLLVNMAKGHLTLNGDLFDGFTVDAGEVIWAYNVLADYLHADENNTVTLGMGNHDASAKGDKTSSFHLLCHILKSQLPGQVTVVDHTCGLTQIDAAVFMIPHMLNQDLFDMEIDKAQKFCPGNPAYLLLHCNILSPFAEHSDHSLNLNQDQIDRLVAAGWTMIVGHEHPGKTYEGRRVILPGNQICSSVSDCLGNKDMAKYYAEITDAGVELHKFADLNDVFIDVDWKSLDDVMELAQYRFIRVTGNCTSEQAADMVTAVAKLRQSVGAFVVANSVKVEGIAQMEGLAEMSMDTLSKFDVVGALLEELDEREQKVVKELLA